MIRVVKNQFTTARDMLIDVANAGGFIRVPDPYRAHRALPTIRPLVDFDTRAMSLADKLPWNLKIGGPNGNTVLNKDFSFTRVLGVRAKRDLSWAPRDIRNEVAKRLSHALGGMTDGWNFQPYLRRSAITRYPETDFPDRSSWLVNEERKVAFNSGRHFESEIFYAISYLPPADTLAKLERGLFRYQGPEQKVVAGFAETHAILDEAINSIKHVMKDDLVFTDIGCRTAKNSLGNEYFCDDQLSFYLRLLTGREQPVLAPRHGTSIAEYLTDHLTLLNDGVLRIGDMLVRPMTIIDYPDSTAPDTFDLLESMPGNFTLGIRYLGRDRVRAEKELRSQRTSSLQKRTGIKDALVDNPDALIDPAASQSASDATEAFGLSRRQIVNYGYTTITVVAYEPVGTSLETSMQQVTKLSESLLGRLRGDGFLVSTEDGNELEGLLGFLPGNGHENVVRGMLHNRNIANITPTITPYLGNWNAPDVANYGKGKPPLAVFPAYGTTPYAFNFHSKQRGGHTLIVAGVGGGKSTLVGFLLNQARKYNPQILVVDYEFQHWVHMQTTAGARSVVLSPSSKTGLSPLAGSDPDGILVRYKWLSMLLDEQQVDVKAHNESIYAALHYLMSGAPDQQTISGFMNAPGISPNVRDALRIYARGGPFGNIFDNPPEDIYAPFTVYETSKLPKDGGNYAIALAALDMELTRKTWQRRPSIIASEEAWEQIQHPIGGEIFQRGLRLKRRQGAAYILITHAIEDIDSSPHAKSMMTQFVTRIILPDRSATSDNAERLKKFGLEPWEREALVSHVGQHAAYIINEEGRRMIDTSLGPVARATVGLTDTNDIERATAVLNEFGSDFYPELVFNEFQPHESQARAVIAESWRRHAYFFPHRKDSLELPHRAPAHEFPHPDDALGPFIDEHDPLGNASENNQGKEREVA